MTRDFSRRSFLRGGSVAAELAAPGRHGWAESLAEAQGGAITVALRRSADGRYRTFREIRSSRNDAAPARLMRTRAGWGRRGGGLVHGEIAIAAHMLQVLLDAAGPADIDRGGFGIRSQSEMRAHVA